jgi:hypothetical protein
MATAVSMLAGMVVFIGGRARGDETVAEAVKKACHKELTTFCKGVVPGEGRILACLYAFEDRVSDQCEYGLYQAAETLQAAVTALQFAATQCKDDLAKFCANVKAGQGRALACLNKNQKDVSQQCNDALKQTGLRK